MRNDKQDDWMNGDTEKHVELLSDLCHGLNSKLSGFWLFDKPGQISRYGSSSNQCWMTATSPSKTRSTPESPTSIYKAHIICSLLKLKTSISLIMTP